VSRPRILRDRQVELMLGAATFLVSAWLIYDAYEGRGRTRPFAARFLP
jgi:hypothetical protein